MKFNEKINLLLKEYVNSDMSALARYIGSSEESRIQSLPTEYPYLLQDFLDDEDIDISELDINTDAEAYEIVDELQQNGSEYFKQFGEWLYHKVKNQSDLINPVELPSWIYFDDPKLIKNQWLVHFTNDAELIVDGGFKFGIDEIDKLGLTTYYTQDAKKYGGYNFAYLVSDKFKMQRGKYVYGDQVVLFRASGYRFWHNGDEEYQVIFRGDTATNLIAITNEDDGWTVHNIFNGNSIFKNEKIDVVIKWIIDNYEQYRKVLHGRI